MLSFFSLHNKGGNNKTLKNRLNQSGIDYSHISNPLIRCAQLSKFRNMNSKADNELFVENSSSGRSMVRRRLLKTGLISYSCTICSMGNNWNGADLSLVLDHINGVFNDNRISNLRFLCPNCNSQQSTFAGRKLRIREVKRCFICKSKKLSSANVSGICLFCFRKNYKLGKETVKNLLLTT